MVKGTGSGRTEATAFAPATVANVAVGFDVLGFALEGVGDRVTARVVDEPGVRVDSIRGVVTDLPTDPTRNTAAVALAALIESRGLAQGFRLSLEKGIPLGSGMGGSAASAVGAVVAANALLPAPLGPEELLGYALAGEAVAGGAAHADNVAPCLFGGLTAVIGADPLEIINVPVPPGVLAVVVHPQLTIETHEARRVLRADLPLGDHVAQSMRLTGFLAGCYTGDTGVIGRSMRDLIVEPQRSALIPGFDLARDAARSAGALGFGISGSGPSVFAWVASAKEARQVGRAVVEVFADQGLASEMHLSEVGAAGAHVESRDPEVRSQ